MTGPGLDRHPVEAAPGLLGVILVSEVDDRPVSLVLTEVEAYSGTGDAASHSHGGPTPRCASMFGPSGRLYVYRSHGIHWCANVVTEPEGVGSAVLLRGGRLIRGTDVAVDRRGRSDHLTDGPGKLCQALGITGAHDGLDLLDAASPVRLVTGSALQYTVTPRIGISKAVDLPWRFLAAE